MNIKDYTNEEVLKECLVSFSTLCLDFGSAGKVSETLLAEFKSFEAEVLERMEK